MRNKIVFLALVASLLAIAGGCKGETANENITPTGTYTLEYAILFVDVWI